jgi:hypothetical protein
MMSYLANVTQRFSYPVNQWASANHDFIGMPLVGDPAVYDKEAKRIGLGQFMENLFC